MEEATQHAGRKVALVTGAAGGIGRAIVKRLLVDGWAVGAVDRDAVGLHHLVERFPEHPLRQYVADLRQVDACRNAVATIRKWNKRLDALVNCAGLGGGKPLDQQVESDWQKVIDIDLTAPYHLTKAAATALAAGRGGSVVNISSTRAYQSEPGWEPYAAAKAGLIGLTHALAASLSPTVRVNAICPGWICCDEDEDLSDADHEQHWSGRVGRPEDVAGLVAYLIGDDAGFVTGQAFTIDGGMTRKMIYEA